MAFQLDLLSSFFTLWRDALDSKDFIYGFLNSWNHYTLSQGVLDKIRGVDTDFQPWILQQQTCPDLQVKPGKFVAVKFRVETELPLP